MPQRRLWLYRTVLTSASLDTILGDVIAEPDLDGSCSWDASIPKKGLDVLLEAWFGLGKLTDNWELVLAGPDEAGTAGTLRRRYPASATSASYRFAGLVEGKAKLELLFGSDAFVLTSYSEGFPMAVIEAMAASLPVLVSRSCNIDGVETRGAGYECEPSVGSVRTALTLSAARRRGFSCSDGRERKTVGRVRLSLGSRRSPDQRRL